MKLIDRLTIKAKNAAKLKAERLITAFITLDEASGMFQADCRLWNGKKGSGTRSIVSEHKSERKAFEAISHIADEYPNDKDVQVIYGEYDLAD